MELIGRLQATAILPVEKESLEPTVYEAARVPEAVSYITFYLSTVVEISHAAKYCPRQVT
jgi:hypothetical protein